MSEYLKRSAIYSGICVLAILVLFIALLNILNLGMLLAVNPFDQNKDDNYVQEYSYPDKLPNFQTMKCSDQIEGKIMDYVLTDKYVVYIVNHGNYDNTFFLRDETINVFSDSCEKIAELDNDEEILKSADTISEISLSRDVLSLKYHVSPDTSVVREYDISRDDSRYFNIWHTPSGETIKKEAN